MVQTDTIDIYVVQAVPYATTKILNQLKLAIRTQRDMLVAYDSSQSVLDVTALRDILDTAAATRRPVRFIRW